MANTLFKRTEGNRYAMLWLVTILQGCVSVEFTRGPKTPVATEPATSGAGSDLVHNFGVSGEIQKVSPPRPIPSVTIFPMKGRNGAVQARSPAFRDNSLARAHYLMNGGRNRVSAKTAALAIRINAARLKTSSHTGVHYVDFEVKIKNVSGETFAWAPLLFTFYDSKGKLLGADDITALGKATGPRTSVWKPGFIQTTNVSLEIPEEGLEVSQYEVLIPNSGYIPPGFTERGVFAIDSVPTITDGITLGKSSPPQSRTSTDLKEKKAMGLIKGISVGNATMEEVFSQALTEYAKYGLSYRGKWGATLINPNVWKVTYRSVGTTSSGNPDKSDWVWIVDTSKLSWQPRNINALLYSSPRLYTEYSARLNGQAVGPISALEQYKCGKLSCLSALSNDAGDPMNAEIDTLPWLTQGN